MSAWWTYRPADFLMFSPRIYWRLFETMNEAAWPAQALLVAAGLAWLGLIRRRPRAQGRAAVRGAAALLAGCWALVTWGFMLARFAPINPVAGGFAVLFALQGLGLLAAAAFGGSIAGHRGARRLSAMALGAWALLGHPLLGAAFGRPWQQAEVFGLAPDPTAIGTLAFLLLIEADGIRTRWLLRSLWITPLAWLATSAATLATMDSAQAWVVLAAAALAGAAGLRR